MGKTVLRVRLGELVRLALLILAALLTAGDFVLAAVSVFESAPLSINGEPVVAPSMIVGDPVFPEPADAIEWTPNKRLTVRGDPSDEYLRGWCDGWRQNSESRNETSLSSFIAIATATRGQYKCSN